MTKSNLALLAIRNGGNLTKRQKIQLTWQLSLPAIMAQFSFIIMVYIDSSMVGSLGAECSAAVGLVSTSTWLISGLAEAIVVGFAVMVSHRIGANNYISARSVLRQSISTCLIFSSLLTLCSIVISFPLPHLLNGGDDICEDASSYFFIFSCSLIFLQFNYLGASMLRSSGNVKIPCILNILLCFLDVIFNYFLIYNSHTIDIFSFHIEFSGFGLGVSGAALGTALAYFVVSILMMSYLIFKSKELSLLIDKGSFKPTKKCVLSALKIGLPVGVERSVMSLAAITITAIVAPLGNVAIAADTFAVTIEGFCYMAGYGISDAATTLIGQCVGAGRRCLAKSFAYITTILGVITLTIFSTLMYFFCPFLLEIMTPVAEIVSSGVEILRIEAFAEPMFAVAIVSYGVFVGAGDSLIPSIMNLASMWFIRIPLVIFLASFLGLKGVWIAMAIELILRGLFFLFRLRSSRWLKYTIKSSKL
ncbi:MAG: MATE family efflux transporter [Bacteroidales bacterium]|nr:MATE family efflux transporter [Bacteroidales bacterium]